MQVITNLSFYYELRSLLLAGFQWWKTYLLVKSSFLYMVAPFMCGFFPLGVESAVEWKKNSKSKV